MSQAAETLISLLLPEGILDYFELTKVDKEGKMLNIYLQEKN
ncbi:transposase, partial [Pedobacter petrophilus]|nr:transposase [Pedobacter petrophilus]